MVASAMGWWAATKAPVVTEDRPMRPAIGAAMRV